MTSATKYKFVRQFNRNYKGTPYQNESGVSMTQPSMTLTVKELMERHTRGLETDIRHKEEIYLEEGEEVPRITDLTDIVYMKEELQEREEQLKKQVEDDNRKAEARRKAEQSSKDSRKEPQSHEDDIPTENKKTKE